MNQVRCPRCGSEDQIRPVKNPKEKSPLSPVILMCFECFHKNEQDAFVETYQEWHDSDGEPEYDPCQENGQYY